MWLPSVSYIGVLPASGRPLTYTALDSKLNLLALGQGDLAEILAFCGGQKQAFVAIASPRSPARGLLQDTTYRETLGAPLHPGRWKQGRVAEFLLRQHNLRMLPTPSDESASPSWMRQGFRLYRELERMGYQPYPTENAPRQTLEVYPHAAYATLLGHLPFRKNALEGRIQRQLLLRLQGLDLPDPMRIFEEFTRHRILQGILPTEGLYAPEELDVLMAAFTAYRAGASPQEVTLIGDPSEGQIVLPGAELKSRYGMTG